MHFTPKLSFMALAAALASTLVACATPAVIGEATAASAAIGAASAESLFSFYIPWSRVFNRPQGATATTTAIGAAPVSPTSDAALIDGHVYICTDANFDCTNYGFITNVCSNLPSEFQDYISSFGPDAGWACTFYIDANCSGGIYVGTDIPGWLNDAFSSVRCVPGA